MREWRGRRRCRGRPTPGRARGHHAAVRGGRLESRAADIRVAEPDRRPATGGRRRSVPAGDLGARDGSGGRHGARGRVAAIRAPVPRTRGSARMLAFHFYTTESNLGALNLLSGLSPCVRRRPVSVGGSLATHAAIAVIAVIAVIAAHARAQPHRGDENALPPDSSIPAKERSIRFVWTISICHANRLPPSAQVRRGHAPGRAVPGKRSSADADLDLGRPIEFVVAARVRPLCRASVTAARSANALPSTWQLRDRFRHADGQGAQRSSGGDAQSDHRRVEGADEISRAPDFDDPVTRGGFRDTPASPTTSTMVRTRGWVWPASASTPSETNSKAWRIAERRRRACLPASDDQIADEAQSPYAGVSASSRPHRPRPLSSRRGVK